MARRLDPTIAEMPAHRVIEAAPATTAAAPPPPPEERAQDIWPAICEQFALRILASAYQMGTHLEAIEADEQDADRLEKLYRIDHATTRIRRQAENLQVLLGRRVEDADPQATPLVDVIRAATSAIEYYPRVHIGHVVDLAVTEYAADDIIRVLTELLDNATRFSPPTASVIVSAYITEHGSVLLRVEDSGLGIKPDLLPTLNTMLSGGGAPPLDGNPASHLGLVVVARLAMANQLRIHLTNRQSGGTTASVLIPDGLLCELAPAGRPAPGGASLAPPPRPQAAHRQPEPNVTYLGSAQMPPSHLTLINGQPSDDGDRPARREPVSSSNNHSNNGGGTSGNGLPKRVRESLRDAGSVNGFAPAAQPSSTPQPRTSPESEADRQAWVDETAEFAAGFSDFATGDVSTNGTDLPWSAPTENPEGNPR
ncbi:hypothetical protein HC031_26205 [Planosporangium thailandense]|uniref:histidine kinase n=1 Tax=Planosporangium thailandense TaxID=765197 RepID=A0ABX0Y458_9ACTN|nr:ATP-binding protein [Planosporangium thailandense]NJC73185.1 hypothetical protein [Planosporangium thailandense]